MRQIFNPDNNDTPLSDLFNSGYSKVKEVWWDCPLYIPRKWSGNKRIPNWFSAVNQVEADGSEHDVKCIPAELIKYCICLLADHCKWGGHETKVKDN